MGWNKNYDGYTSFSYLVQGVDYKKFEEAKQKDRVKSSTVRLSQAEEDRYENIRESGIFISLHDHGRTIVADLAQNKEYVRENHVSYGYEGLSISGMDAIFDGLLDGGNYINSKYPWNWESVISELGMRFCDFDHQSFVIAAKKTDDIIRAHKEGKIAFIAHLEGAGPIGNELDRIDILYGLGLRCMGITYSESNTFGTGLKEDNDGGLTDLGKDAVNRMNKLGMAIDIAHCGDQTSLDVIEESKTPIFITHAGARTLWNTKRLKPDDVIQALAEKGGVIGVEAAPHTTITKNHPHHNIESVMDHLQYLINLVGIDHVAMGPDTNFGDHVGIHHLNAKELSIAKSHAGVQFEEVEFVDGIENPGQFSNVARWLIKNGYSDVEVKKIMGENVLRVLHKVWI